MFYAMAAGALAALVGSAYYLYSLFAEEELSEEDMVKIEELKEELTQQMEEKSGGALTPEIAVQIMAMTTKVGEEMIKKLKPDIDSRRRAALNRGDEYEIICQEYLEAREYCFQDATKKVLLQFGNYTFEDIQKAMMELHPSEFERINHKYEHATFDVKPDRDTVKRAYIFYGRKFKDEMTNLQKIMPPTRGQEPDMEQQQFMFFKLLMIKFKVDDLLYIKYKYTESQIKYLLFEYNLIEDPEVREINDQLARLDSQIEGF